jgi:hypothetical protein
MNPVGVYVKIGPDAKKQPKGIAASGMLDEDEDEKEDEKKKKENKAEKAKK